MATPNYTTTAEWLIPEHPTADKNPAAMSELAEFSGLARKVLESVSKLITYCFEASLHLQFTPVFVNNTTVPGVIKPVKITIITTLLSQSTNKALNLATHNIKLNLLPHLNVSITMNRPYTSRLRVPRAPTRNTDSSDEFEELIRLNSSDGRTRERKRVEFAVDPAVENEDSTFREAKPHSDSQLSFYPELRDALYKRIAGREAFCDNCERSSTPLNELKRAIEQKCFLEREMSTSSFAKRKASFVRKDSVANNGDLPAGKKESQEEVNETSRFFPELHEFVDKRFMDARLDLMENRLERETTNQQDKTEAQSLLLKLMLAKIDDLERQLQTRTVPVTRRNSLQSHQSTPRKPSGASLYLYSSNFVMDKATQTPSKDHESEGVYVMVSRKTGAKAKKAQRKFSYGYPEYVTKEETAPLLDRKIVTQSVMFLPPIPDPMSKRRPRDAKPGKHAV